MKRTFIYILSPSYSGSTLLTALLARHPEIVTIGELKATHMGDVDKYVCSCGELIMACPFWTRLRETLAARNIDFSVRDFGTHFRSPDSALLDRIARARVRGPLFETARQAVFSILPGARRWLDGLVARNHAIIDAVMELQRGSNFLDASKDPVRLHYFLRSDRWDFKVIHLIRDGRGTSNSYMKHYDVDMASAAHEWRGTHQECSRLLARLPRKNKLVMRYEDFCTDVADHMKDLWTFLDVAPQDFDVTDHDGAAPRVDAAGQHILGNPMRLRGIDKISCDERWRTELDAEALQTFDRIAGDLNRSYGYNGT